MRVQNPPPVLEVVLSFVVVGDLDVAIFQQTLCDEQVMGFVAAWGSNGRKPDRHESDESKHGGNTRSRARVDQEFPHRHTARHRRDRGHAERHTSPNDQDGRAGPNQEQIRGAQRQPREDDKERSETEEGSPATTVAMLQRPSLQSG